MKISEKEEKKHSVFLPIHTENSEKKKQEQVCSFLFKVKIVKKKKKQVCAFPSIVKIVREKKVCSFLSKVKIVKKKTTNVFLPIKSENCEKKN